MDEDTRAVDSTLDRPDAGLRGLRTTILKSSQYLGCTAAEVLRLLNEVDSPALKAYADIAHAHLLRRQIVTGVLPMGAHLHEQSLADELGVGRPALREALRTLEREGLVVHVPRAGSHVVELTLTAAHELVVVREHLEELALTQGVPTPAPGRLDALRDAVAAMFTTAAARAEQDAALDGVACHRAFIALAGNHYLDGAFAMVADPLGILMHLNRSVAAAGGVAPRPRRPSFPVGRPRRDRRSRTSSSRDELAWDQGLPLGRGSGRDRRQPANP